MSRGPWRYFDEVNREGLHLDHAWIAVWTRWGEMDGPRVLDFLLNDLTQEKVGHAHFQAAMDDWAAVDPARAESWLGEHRDAPHYTPPYRSLTLGTRGKRSR